MPEITSCWICGAFQRAIRRAGSEAGESASSDERGSKSPQQYPVPPRAGAQLSFHYDRKQIILERSEVSENLGRQYVELYDFADRPLEGRWRGLLLPHRVFSKDQRVSHTAIVENKRLGHALALVKAQQDLRHTTRVMTNSEKTGYRKRTRIVNAPPLVLSDVLNS
jgi:hypothetical protein